MSLTRRLSEHQSVLPRALSSDQTLGRNVGVDVLCHGQARRVRRLSDRIVNAQSADRRVVAQRLAPAVRAIDVPDRLTELAGLFGSLDYAFVVRAVALEPLDLGVEDCGVLGPIGELCPDPEGLRLRQSRRGEARCVQLAVNAAAVYGL